MERSVAIKKLGKLLGKQLCYRVDDKAPKRDEREAAREQLKDAIAARQAALKAREERMKAILDADPEYQRLVLEARAAATRADKLLGTSHHYKFTVGTSNGMFFHVKAQGDSWEEVIDKLTTERKTGNHQ